MSNGIILLPSTIPLMETLPLRNLTKNSLNVAFDNGISSRIQPDYEQFFADIWVGIVLTLMVLICVCCMCSCLLYHKFQQWKRSESPNLESGMIETELPSYTIASGLPSYQEAIEQLQRVKQLTGGGKVWVSSSSSSSQLCVINLFPLYKSEEEDSSTKPS